MEAGFEINPVQNLTAGLTFYQINMKNEISWNDIDKRNENLDETRHRGVEISLDYRRKDLFDIKINYTYQESTFENGDNSGNNIPLVPNNLLSAIFDLYLPYNIHLIPSLRYIGDSYLSGDVSNTAKKLNDYTVVDLLLRYKKNIRQSQITFFLGINNLFDEEYSSYGSDWGGGFYVYYPSPGRKFYGGVSATF